MTRDQSTTMAALTLISLLTCCFENRTRNDLCHYNSWYRPWRDSLGITESRNNLDIRTVRNCRKVLTFT